MADAVDSKSTVGDNVGVRVPSRACSIYQYWQAFWSKQEACFFCENRCLSNTCLTYTGVMSIVKEHAGAYGLGVEYSKTML